MQATTRDQRRQMRCGFELPPTDPTLRAWSHEALEPPAEFEPGAPYPTTCVGYVRRLPEVIEIARARAHWDKGQLEMFCGGDPPENALFLLELFEIEVRRLEQYVMDNASKREG